MKLNGMPFAVARAVKADRLQREPARGWHRKSVATKAVITPLDAKRHQRSSGAAKAARAKAVSPLIA